MATSVVKPAPQSGLLFALSPELRLIIYALLLVSNLLIPIYSYTRDDIIGRLLAVSAAIIRTCSQIYDEAKGILYKSNTFYFPRPGINLGPFLKRRRLEDYMSIKSVAL